MADNMQLMYARSAYSSICKALDSIGWQYNRKDEELKITYGVNGDHMNLNFLIIVDAERQVVRLISLLPFQMYEDKCIDGAAATCAINYILADGSFDCDIEDGHIMFRIASSFKGSFISEELAKHLIYIGCFTVDKYNIMLKDLNDGNLTLVDLVKKINQ